MLELTREDSGGAKNREFVNDIGSFLALDHSGQRDPSRFFKVDNTRRVHAGCEDTRLRHLVLWNVVPIV